MNAESSPSNAKIAPPAPAPPRPYAFPKPVRRLLPNGLTVYVIEDHRLPVISYALEILAGNCDTSPAQAGLASFTAGLLREGAGAHTSPEISSLIDGWGGSLGASAGDDYSTAGGTFMKSYAAAGLDLLADIVLRPRFEPEEIERRREQLLSGLVVNLEDPAYIASLAASRAILGAHPYAYPGDGTPETIKSLQRRHIQAFWKRTYSPQRAWLAISGDVTPAEGFRMAESAFGAWAANSTPDARLPAPPPAAPRVLVIDMPQSVQTQIAIGQPGIPRNHPQFLPLFVANQIFGGSFNSRLNMKIRTEEGLTYDASSGLEAQRQAGSFTVTTFTRTEKTAAAVRMIVDLLKEFLTNPATPAEFDEAKSFLYGSFALATETSGQVADRILSAAVNGLGEEYWTGYRERLNALTLDQVRSATASFLKPAALTIVAVGDAKAFRKELAAYGPLTTIPSSKLDLLAPDLFKAGV